MGILELIDGFSAEILAPSPIQFGLNLKFSSISAAALDCSYVLLRKQNEIGRSLYFNAQTSDNPRLAYSNSRMIWYSLLCATKKAAI